MTGTGRGRLRAWGSVLLLAALAAGGIRPRDARATPSPETGCTGEIAHRMDFWIGTWDVRSPGGDAAGTNVIERVLGGCAVLEHWTDADGSAGKSLFYVDRLGGRWKQVWVTDDGAFKEKTEVPGFAEGMRFQGEIPLADGRRIQDRTTLSVLADGRVRQRIEQSRDAGKSWRAWEGLYTRSAASSGSLSAADVDAIRDVHREYRDAWVAGDAARVMATLASDAVLLPSGLEPVTGAPAIRDFWWPGGAPTRILSFDVTVDEVAGRGDIAWTRGHDHLVWTTSGGDAPRTIDQRASFLDTLERGGDGRWRITRHMWSDIRPKR
jgi:ketosteroid isomerase-like protein